MHACCFFLLLHSVAADARWQEQLPQAQLLGAGDFRFLGLRVYSAQLWTTEPRAAGTRPFALQLRYHRTISRERLVQTSLDEMTRLADKAPDKALLEDWRQLLLDSFVSVRSGDVITGVFLPGQGVEFYVGDKLQYAVDDPVFAQAFFAIWLDPETRAPALRQQLLGATLP